jgi:hypothetical protein
MWILVPIIITILMFAHGAYKVKTSYTVTNAGGLNNLDFAYYYGKATIVSLVAWLVWALMT